MKQCGSMWLLTLLIFATTATAGTLDEIGARLSPIKATVLTDKGGEVLLDVGSNSGVVPSDLFAVSGKGAPIVHPQTGAIIGDMPVDKGVVQIVWVKENFCGARRVRGDETLQPGDSATRYAGLSAKVLGCDEGAEGWQADLRRQLPQLRWQAFRPASTEECSQTPTGKADLLFVIAAHEVLVRDQDGTLLQRIALPQPTAVNVGTNIQSPSAFGGAAPFRERWYAGDWQGSPNAVVVADLDGDKVQELVVASKRSINVGHSIDRKWQELAHLELPAAFQVLALSAIDVDGDGNAELAISAARETELSSFLYRYRGGEFVEVQRDLPYVLQARESIVGGARVLCGQLLGEKGWNGSVVELTWTNGQLVAGQTLDLPAGTGIRGLAQIKTEKGTSLLRLNRYDQLQVIDNDDNTVWQSDQKYGGSETFIEIADDLAKGNEYNTRNLYVQQRLQSVAANRVLIPMNIGSRLFNRQTSYDESQIELVEWDGRALRTVWETPKEKGYLADYVWADVDNDGSPELAMLIAYSKEGLLTKGQFSLTILEQ